MKTELFGKSNAVLFTDEGEFVAVIGCEGGKNKDISNKLNRAIKDHFCLEDDTDITFDVKEALTNQKSVKFSVSYLEDEEETLRDFEIQIVAHY
jgi:transcription antitermination factor NusA-like protein